MKTFDIYTTNLNEDSKDLLTEDLVSVLVPLLRVDFCKKTFLQTNKKLWFFLLALNATKISDRQFRLKGPIIGPTSIGIESEAIWEVSSDGKISAYWVNLDVDAFVQEYGDTTPQKLDIPKVSFPVKWVFAWETHLPDFYITICFNDKISPSIEKVYLKDIANTAPDYLNVQIKSETKLSIHVSLSDGNALNTLLLEALSLSEKAHLGNKVKYFQIGL